MADHAMALQVKHKHCVGNDGWESDNVSPGPEVGAPLIKTSRNFTLVGGADWSHGNVGVCFLFPLGKPYLKPGVISFEKSLSHFGSWEQVLALVPLLDIIVVLPEKPMGALLTSWRSSHARAWAWLSQQTHPRDSPCLGNRSEYQESDLLKPL